MVATAPWIVACLAVLTRVTAAQYATCFSQRDCAGSVNARESTAARCCLKPPQSLSYQLGDGQCFNCDEVALELVSVEYTVSEGDTFVEVEVMKFGVPTEDILFNVVIEEDTAEGGRDFGLFPEAVVVLPTVILSSETNFTFGVFIRDDRIVEDIETFVVRLELANISSNPPQIMLGRKSVANVAIIDNDFVNATIIQNDTVVMEGNLQLTFIIARDGVTSRNISIGASTRAVSAEAPGDFMMLDQVLVFTPEDFQKTISLTVNEDTIVENTEAFELYLYVPENESGVNILKNSSKITIMDNDTLQLEFGSPEYSTMESDQRVSVAIVKSGQNERPVTVRFFTQNGTATDSGDFTASEQLVTFLPGDLSRVVEVTVSSDGLLEEEEEFVCVLSVPAGETGVVLGRSTTTVIIGDSDVVTVGANESEINLDEAAGVVNVTVSLTDGILGRPIEVEVGTSGQSATEGDDFRLIGSRTLRFDETVSEQTVSIEILEDTFYEGLEVFRLQLQTDDTGVQLMPQTVEISIIDNEQLVVRFGNDTYQANETESLVQVEAILEVEVERDVIVTVSTEDGTATDGLDYVSLSSLSLTFNNVVRSHVIDIGLLDDDFSEGIEEFAVVLQHSGGVLAKATIRLFEDEFVRVQFNQTEYVVGEEDQFVGVVIRKTGNTQQDIDFLLVISDGTARGGRDYGSFPEEELRLPVVILADESSFEFGILIREDERVEATESFTVRLIVPDGTPGVQEAEQNTEAVVLIEDNDSVNVTVEPGNYLVSEGEGSLELRFNVSRDPNVDLDRPVYVVVFTERGTASDPGDFVAYSETLEFGPEFGAVTTYSVTVQVRNDAAVENTEAFFVTVTPGPGELGALVLQNSSLVQIVDNDVVEVGFTDLDLKVSEGDRFVVLRVLKEGDNERTVTVNAFAVDGTAVESLDYNGTDFIVEFPPGSTEIVSLEIPILDDDLVETNKMFSVALEVPANESGVSLTGNRSTVVVTVEDDDAVMIELELAEYAADEGDNVSIVVTKTGRNTKPVTVAVSTEDETATSPADYLLLNGTVEFPPSDSDTDTATIVVVLFNDAVYEGTKSFLVRLDIPAGAEDIRLGQRRNATVTILNDDVVMVGIERTNYTVDEGDSLEVCVIKNGQNDVNVTIDIFTEQFGSAIGNRAIGNRDYVSTRTSLTFDPSSDRLCVNIVTRTDSMQEVEEIFGVAIQSPVEDVRLFRANATINITDTTPGCRIQMELGTYTVREGDGSAVVCVLKSGMTIEDIGVRVETSNTGSDVFEHTSEVFLFPSGVSDARRCAVVPLNDDEVALEAEQMFQVLLTVNGSCATPNPQSSDVIVVDDDILTVQFTAEGYEVLETDGTVTVCVNKSLETAVVFSLNLEPTAITAEANEDFNATLQTVLFGRQETIVCTDIAIFADSIDEPPESFNVSLRLPNLPRVSLGPISTTLVTIIEEVPPMLRIEFDPSVYPPVNEGSGTIAVRMVKRGADINQAVTVLVSTQPGTAKAFDDFIPLDLATVNLTATDTEAFVSVAIVDDSEIEPFIEHFTLSLDLPPAARNLEVGPPIEIRIEDNDGLFGNDTVVGDPLFTVPLLPTSDSQQVLMNEQPHLCYEIHGRAGSYFNLVSDMCTSVNAYYTVANETSDWNVITVVGVKAVNSLGDCIEVSISADTGCEPVIREPGATDFLAPYRSNGVSVRKVRNRVRVSVPNCNRTNLVMWITCTDVGVYQMLHFTIRRGINMRPSSHGLVGQFWNIPITFEPYAAMVDTPYVDMEDLYVVTVNPPDSASRKFVAEYYQQTWESRNELCFYAGSSQGGSIKEIVEPNDPVVQGSYTDYVTDSLFSTSFTYSQFDQSLC